MDSSLYIHIPFCKRLCGYCDFYKTLDLARKGEVLGAMADEMERRGSFLDTMRLRTVYFGGGTPSVCSAEELAALTDRARSLWSFDSVEEITVEANPDDLSVDYLAALRSAGVNRLSMGVQSFDAADLRFMNRRHDAAQAVQAVADARRAGFDNISIDLIYGLPDRDAEKWRKNVVRAAELRPEHISAYFLTIEPNTVFGRRKIASADDETARAEYAVLCDLLAEAGYEHYEISNFALPGRRSRHNGAYWTGAPYLGIGPSAHSYDGRRKRSWNAASVAEYMKGAEPQAETLSEQELYEEFVMLRLRTVEGVPTGLLEQRFGSARKEEFMRRAERHFSAGTLHHSLDAVAFTPSGWFVSDDVTSDFFD